MFLSKFEIHDEDFIKYMNETDKNGDGIIDIDEFEEMIKGLLSRHI